MKVEDIYKKLAANSGISWKDAHKHLADGRAVPAIVTELLQMGPHVVTDVKRIGNIVHYKVDAKLENRAAEQLAVFLRGFMKGLQMK